MTFRDPEATSGVAAIMPGPIRPALNVSGRKCQGKLAFGLRFEQLELADRAAAADARMDGIALDADKTVRRLKIETAVKVECGAIVVELGPNPAAVGEHEIDLLGAELQRPADRGGGDAIIISGSLEKC